jgi:uncharacterized membrane protein
VERWDLAAGHTPPAWILGIVGLMLGLAGWEAVRAFVRPRAPRSRALGAALLSLRVLGMLSLLMLVFELTLRIDQIAPAGRRIVVLVDRSASMALADAPAPGDEAQTRQSRIERVWAESASARSGWRDDGYLVEVRGFDGRTETYAGQVAQTLATKPTGAASDLARALTELSQPGPDEVPLSAVVVVSDGLVAEDEATDAHVRSVAEALAVPVTTVAAGAPQITDISVASVRAGEFAFVENVAEFEASLVAHGLPGQAAEVELRRDGKVVASRRVRLDDDGVERPVRFEVAPDRVGQFVYEIAVVPHPGEATTDNNRRAFVVKVLRDKVRVLHVAGRPDWDVRALRTLLRRDPNVELLSYYILRDHDDIRREDTTAPLSLIPFPTDELFEEQLGSFDLLILHNFDAQPHQVAEYIDNIAQYVVDGGALVVIGGDLGPTDGGYAVPALAATLPVDMRRPSPLRHEPFAPTVTDAGRRHPITSWLSAAGWDDLPPLPNYNPLALASHAETIGGSALLVHPSDVDAQGRPRPIVSVAEPGRGRTVMLATGGSWRLGFAAGLPLIDGARPYDLLWLGTIRWLLRDDTSGRLQLETDRPRYRVGEAVELTAKTVTTAYAPQPDVAVSWEIRELREDTPEARGAPAARGRWTTDALGRARQVVEELGVGAYEAIARREDVDGSDDASSDDAEATSAAEVRRVFIVEPPGRELSWVDADPGTARLEALAEATGGNALVAARGDTLPRTLPVIDPFAERPGLRVDARREIPLWNGWLMWALLAVGFGGEWILRRRAGET